MGNIKTVTISAETAVKFDSFYPYVWIKNTGDTIAYASAFSGIVAGAENVTAIPAGESVMITAETDTVYILSTGTTAEVHGQGYAESPFLDNYSEGGGTSITVESLSVTENGTYTAQTGKAYSPVTVSVPQQVEIITRANWDLLTEQQKQAKGLCAIQDYSTGFMRGEFVNGADYIQANKYIPYSDENKIIGVAYPDLFDASANSWGYGTNPVLYTGTGGKPTLDTTENAVFFPTGTSDVIGYIDLGKASAPFTAYVVMKTQSTYSGRIISSFNLPNAGQMIMLANENNIIHVDRWGDSSSLDVSATDYFVAALSCDISAYVGYGYAYDALNDTIKSSAKSVMYGNGRYLTIGRTDIDPNVSYPSPTDVYVKYIAVVNQQDTNAVVENNLRALYSSFVGE